MVEARNFKFGHDGYYKDNNAKFDKQRQNYILKKTANANVKTTSPFNGDSS